jgi:hypothetical protein
MFRVYINFKNMAAGWISLTQTKLVEEQDDLCFTNKEEGC